MQPVNRKSGKLIFFQIKKNKHELLIRQPVLPEFVDRFWIRQLCVGSARADLYYKHTSAKICRGKKRGELRVVQL